MILSETQWEKHRGCRQLNATLKKNTRLSVMLLKRVRDSLEWIQEGDVEKPVLAGARSGCGSGQGGLTRDEEGFLPVCGLHLLAQGALLAQGPCPNPFSLHVPLTLYFRKSSLSSLFGLRVSFCRPAWPLEGCGEGPGPLQRPSTLYKHLLPMNAKSSPVNFQM